jgi:hypothetical protein
MDPKQSAPVLRERIEWRRRIARALARIKSDGVSELTRRAGLIVVPALACAACGYNANTYKKGASSTTTTTGAYTWSSNVAGDRSEEEEAERAEREERETTERQARARAQTETHTWTANERAAFAQELKIELANVESDADDIRSRAAMAGQASRARVQRLLNEVAARRAQLEVARKRLQSTSGADWTRAHDEAQQLLADVKAHVRAARDAL